MFKSILIKPEKFFVFIGIIWGLIFLIINPPFQAPDEDAHLIKMWGMLNGSFNFKVYEGYKVQEIPKSMGVIIDSYNPMKFDYKADTKISEILSHKNIPLNKNQIKYYKHTPTGYTIVSYLPSILILAILKFFNIAPFYMIYILRFCCLLCYLALTYSAIKITPYKKWLFVIIGLIPGNLYIAGAISTDCLVLGSTFLLIAYTFYLKFSEKVENISNKEIVIWCFIFTYLCVLKYLYFPIILLYFLLPKEKFDNTKKYYLVLISLISINLFYIVLFIVNTLNLSCIGIDDNYTESISKSDIIKSIINRPIGFLHLILTTAIWRAPIIFTSLIAQFGWAFFFLPIPISMFFYGVIFASGFYKNEKIYNFALHEKLIFSLIIVAQYILVMTSLHILYMTYPLIEGWQGRYGAPLVPLLFCVLTDFKISYKNKFLPIIAFLIMQFVYLYSILIIIFRFY